MGIRELLEKLYIGLFNNPFTTDIESGKKHTSTLLGWCWRDIFYLPFAALHVH